MKTPFKNRGPVKLIGILSAGPVAQLIATVRATTKLQERLKTFLGDKPAEHFSLVRQSSRDLVLLADSPVWSSYLRFRVPMILEHLQNECGQRGLENIHVKVSIPADGTDLRSNKSATPARLSPGAANHLKRIAESTADPGLKSIYERISRRGAD